MICPNCSLDQPQANEKCPRCGIIFANWEALEIRSPEKRTRPKALPPTVEALPRPTLKAPGPALIILKIVCVLGVIAGWYWYVVPSSGLPVPEKAYRDERNAFALTMPPEMPGGRVKNCGGPKKMCEVFAAEQKEPSGRVRQAVSVGVVEFSEIMPIFSAGSIHFTNSNKDEYSREALKGLEGLFASFQIQETTVVKVDAIPSLRIEGAGFYAGQTLRSVFALIPGSSKLYLFSYAGPAEEATDVDGMIQSFRVLERHPSLFNLYGGFWGSLKGDLILGFLAGFTLATLRLFGLGQRR